MPKNLLLYLSLLLFSTASFSQEPVKGWTATDRKDFIDACVESAKTSLGADTARYYCTCMQIRVEQQYPTVEAANKLTEADFQKPEWQKLILECLNKDEANKVIRGGATRGQDGVIAVSQEITRSGKFYALVIGVSSYNNPRLNLENPATDATKIKSLLVQKYTFEEENTFLLLNPTRQKIISELFRLRKVIGADDNFLIFYAGHGYWDADAKQGYWWAKDAAGDDPSTWLSNSDLREQIRSIKSQHTLLISDACFSGGIFRSRDASEIMNAGRDIQQLYRMPSRRAITSGTMTAVPDRSVFLEYLYKRLNDNTSKFLSSEQLFDSFRAAVINNSTVVPQDGVIAETGDEGGDFIFIRRN